MALDPSVLAGEDSGARKDERDDGPGWVDPARDDRPEDREDDTDRAIKLARAHCIEAIDYLVAVMQSKPLKDTSSLDVAAAEVRLKAAIAILEVAGCL